MRSRPIVPSSSFSFPGTGGQKRGLGRPALRLDQDGGAGRAPSLLPLARSEGLRPDDPTEGIRPPRREPYARARGRSAGEVARLLGMIPADSAAGLRLRALVLAYLLTGRRRSEVLNLRWRDLDLEGGFYRYVGKGGKERQRALPPPVRQAILAYAGAPALGVWVTMTAAIMLLFTAAYLAVWTGYGLLPYGVLWPAGLIAATALRGKLR
jgi:integrase